MSLHQLPFGQGAGYVYADCEKGSMTLTVRDVNGAPLATFTAAPTGWEVVVASDVKVKS